jgi:NTE family protein
MAAGTDAPDVLVLGGGGLLGEAWMLAVLTGIEEANGVDLRRSGRFVGTSAGSIVAATLAAGLKPRARLGEAPSSEPASATEAARAGPAALAGAALRMGRAASVLVAPLALSSTAWGGAMLRRVALSRVPRGRRSLRGLAHEIERSGVDWGGRLLISAVELDSGRRVMFGAPDAPPTSVATAVEASCAIPGVFRPVEVNGRSYVDGGAWSPTNMDAVPVEPGARVVYLNPTASLRPPRAAPFGPVSRAIAAVEAMALERRGAKVTGVAPDAASAVAMGANLMDGRASSRARVVSAGLAQGRALNLP